MIKEYKPSRTYKKYDYQTHHSSFNHNTYLQNNYINPIKHSINKQSQSHSQNPYMKDQLFKRQPPLSLLNATKPKAIIHTQDKTHNTKNIKALKEKNKNLEMKISEQAQQIEELRQTLLSIKKGSKQSQLLSQESDQFRKMNQSLQNQCQNRSKEINDMKVEVQTLKAKFEQSNITSQYQDQTLQSHVSRRIQYLNNYELIIEDIPQRACSKFQLLKDKYEDELTNLQTKKQLLQIKINNLPNLEQQIDNKNSCIDYLREQVNKFIKNTQDLKGVIISLQNLLKQQNIF